MAVQQVPKTASLQLPEIEANSGLRGVHLVHLEMFNIYESQITSFANWL